jgi:hypothetical protein
VGVAIEYKDLSLVEGEWSSERLCINEERQEIREG